MCPAVYTAIHAMTIVGQIRLKCFHHFRQATLKLFGVKHLLQFQSARKEYDFCILKERNVGSGNLSEINKDIVTLFIDNYTLVYFHDTSILYF